MCSQLENNCQTFGNNALASAACHDMIDKLVECGVVRKIPPMEDVEGRRCVSVGNE